MCMIYFQTASFRVVNMANLSKTANNFCSLSHTDLGASYFMTDHFACAKNKQYIFIKLSQGLANEDRFAILSGEK
jgi:hypothetical protein